MNCCTANKIVRALGAAAGITLVASSALAGTTAADRTASRAPVMTTGATDAAPGPVRFNPASLDARRQARGGVIGAVGVSVGVDGGSDCCEANGTPGCDDPVCEAAVCAVDPFCCNTSWDGLCAGTAFQLCPDLCSVDPVDPIDCGPDATPEGEVCSIPIPADNFNGGCNSTPNVFSAISLGEVVSGTTGDDGGTRDTDWYQITLPAGSYAMVLQTNGNAVWGFIGDALGPVANPTCASISQINPFATGNGGTVVAGLTGGVYWLFVSTNGFNNQGCFDYCLQVVDAAGLSGACCVEGNCVDNQSPGDCASLGGTFQGDGSDCASVSCPQAFCGGADTGDCCVANGTPFCNDAACCNAICAFDPFCCDTAWDGICAAAAQTECAVCNIPSACCFPGAVCQELSQNDCAAFAGVFQGAGVSCADVECPDVQAPENNECETAQAITAADLNGPAIEGTNLFASPAFGLPACGGPLTGPAVWYSFDAVVLGSQTVTVSTCATAGGGGGSDCCFANGTPGCDDPTCEALVCGADPFCCDTSWDGLCAGDAQANCAVCQGGGGPSDVNPDTVLNVFTNTIPDFCLGTFCCVAGNDDFCGLYSQVTFCADASNNDGVYFIVVSGFAGATGSFLLTVSGDGVACGGGGICIECEAGDVLEGEPCPTGVDEFNGGCNSTPNVFSSLNLDEWVCGTADAGGGTRDTDWYVINIPFDGTYDFVLEAAFAAVGGFIGNAAGPVVNPTCASISQINPFITPAPCVQGVVTATLTAGTYWVFVAPANFEGVDCPDSGECPGNGRYRMQVRTGVPVIPCVVDCPMGALVECQDCEDFEGGGGGGEGDCCIANGTPGCNDAACEALICGQDPFCCNTAWDQICANAAIAQCEVCDGGGGGGSDCCTPGGNGTPGCDDPACEALTCGQDPFCCDTSWDGLCANFAIANCAVCQGGVVLGVDEDCNGGCNNEFTPSFDAIACGDTVCGTITAGAGQRDTDWFIIEVTNPDGAIITATLEAEFPGVVFILDVPNCGNISIIDQIGFSSCSEGNVTGQPAIAAVGPGTYVIFVSAGNPDGSGVFEGITCGNNADYVLTVTGDCAGGPVCPCVADINGDCVVNADDLGILLGDWGCSGSGCVADINGDGVVNADDLGILLGDWGCAG